ncbi:MAG: FAD-dependent thymidylate synthase [Candidatus Amesbacteria bacterium]|nr:FAD-dependent thymidylate synthase [Candidatus Amesbacteria bacterium]
MGKKVNWLKDRGIPYTPEIESLDKNTAKSMSDLMTNVDKPVYAFTDKMPPEVAAALFSRYSRSPRPLRMVLAREFNGADRTKARSFFDRVLAEYGDDSVAQLGVVYLACEMVSVLATKDIEDGRLAAYIEKSTRYVDFSAKLNNHYLYFEPPELKKAKLDKVYKKLMDKTFDLYTELTLATREYLKKAFPIKEGIDEKVYLASIRAKAFDIVRSILPMSTLTNTGLTLSGHAAESMLNKMYANPLWETRKLANEIKTEIDKVIPSLISRSALRSFMVQSKMAVSKIAKRILKKDKTKSDRVKLIWHSDHNLNRVVNEILFPFSRGRVKHKLNIKEKKKLIDAYLVGRTDRRHKPGRAFEVAEYEFLFCDIVGAWKDLQRHRMLTQQRQLLTTEIGYEIPEELKNIKLGNKSAWQVYDKHMQDLGKLYKQICKKVSAEVAQYVVTHGHKMHWTFKVNLRELYHMIPLRASRAGHPAYRRIAREMFYEIAKIDPILAMPMRQFIDFSDEPRLERLKQLEKVKQKLDKLGGKGGDTFI